MWKKAKKIVLFKEINKNYSYLSGIKAIIAFCTFAKGLKSYAKKNIEEVQTQTTKK